MRVIQNARAEVGSPFDNITGCKSRIVQGQPAILNPELTHASLQSQRKVRTGSHLKPISVRSEKTCLVADGDAVVDQRQAQAYFGARRCTFAQTVDGTVRR